MVAEILQRPTVSLSDNLVHLGASSLELIALANRIEAFSGARPPLNELARAVRLPDLVAMVQRLMPQEAAQPADLVAGSAALRAYIARNPALADPVARRLFKGRPPLGFHRGNADFPARSSRSARRSGTAQLARLCRPGADGG